MTLTPEELADVFFTAMEQVAAGQDVTIRDVLTSIYPEAVNESGNLSYLGGVLWNQVLDYERRLHGYSDYSNNRFGRWKFCYETLKSKVR